MHRKYIKRSCLDATMYVARSSRVYTTQAEPCIHNKPASNAIPIVLLLSLLLFRCLPRSFALSFSPALFHFLLRFFALSLAYSLTHSLTHSLTQLRRY